MKYCQIKIVQPIVLHDKEEIDINELKIELELCKELGVKGIYVYRQGVDYPHGGAGDFTWHKIKKVINYIKVYEELRYKKPAIVEWSPDKGFKFSPLN